MHSKQAFILALVSGAGALIISLTALLSLEFLKLAEPYLNGISRPEVESDPGVAPRFITTTTEQSSSIIEVDRHDQLVRTIYSANLLDEIVDFNLFAVPQSNYQGKIYVRSANDPENGSLIVYPLDVVTGKILPAVINVTSQKATLSPTQDRVAVINTAAEQKITVYELTSGTVLVAWTLEGQDRLTEFSYASYSNEGVNWVSSDCFSHAIWSDQPVETRLFCI